MYFLQLMSLLRIRYKIVLLLAIKLRMVISPQVILAESLHIPTLSFLFQI